MKTARPLAVLLDESAPVAIAKPFEVAGFRVIRHGDVLVPGASDKEVANAALLNNAALIAVDLDFREMKKRFGPSATPKFLRLRLILLDCNGVLAPKRVEHMMWLIEHEWAFAEEKTGRGMWVEIGAHSARIGR